MKISPLIIILIYNIQTLYGAIQNCSVYPKKYTNTKSFKENEINLLFIGFFNMYDENEEDKINPTSLILTECLKHHAKRISKTINAITGINFGLLIHDTSCSQPMDVFTKLLVDRSVLSDYSNFTMFNVLTSLQSNKLVDTANIMLPTNMMMMLVTEDDEKDNEYLNDNYDYPISYLQSSADEERAKLILSLIKGTGMEYVTILHDDTNNGKKGKTILERKFKTNDVCIAQILEIPETSNEVERFIDELYFDNRMNIFVVWNHIENKTLNFMNSLHKYNIKNKTWIFSSIFDLMEISNKFITTNKIIFLELDQTTKGYLDTGFVSSFLNGSSIENKWFNYSNRNRTTRGFSETYTKLQVIEADQMTYAMMQKTYDTIKNLQSLVRKHDFTNRTFGDKLNKYFYLSLKNIGGFRLTIKLVKNNSVLVPLETEPLTIKKSCSSDCQPGYYPYYFNKFVTCCWDAKMCSAGYYKYKWGQSSCLKCPDGTSSNRNRTACIPFQTIYPIPASSDLIIMSILATTCTLITLLIIIVFIKFKDTPVVRASDGVKTLVQLSSHILLSILLFTFMLIPSQLVCAMQPFLLGFFMTITASVTFIKTKKLMLIFQARTRLTHKSIVITKVVAITTVVLFISIQIILSFCFYLYLPHEHKNEWNYDTVKNYKTCNNQTLFIIELMYVKLLSILCLYQAFKARKLPENFNETKYIGIAVLVSEIFLLSFMLKPESDSVTNAVLLFCSNFSLTVIMYSYRVYIMLFHPEENNTKVFREKIMKHCKLDVQNRTTTFTSEMRSEMTYSSPLTSRASISQAGSPITTSPLAR